MTLQSKSSEPSTMKTKCPVCGSKEICSSNGFIVCRNCGTCQEREMVQGTYTIGEDQYKGSSQYTDIGNKIHVVNAQGSQIGYQSERQSIFMTSKILRLRRVNYNNMTRIEEKLLRGLKRVNEVAVHLQISPQTRDRAAYLLRKTLPHYPRFVLHNPLVICVLILAVREHQLPITEKEILEIIPTKSRHKNMLNKTKFFLMKTLGVKWPRSRPEWFIPRIISTIRNNPKVLERLEKRKGTSDYFSKLERISVRLLQSMTSVDYGGKSPDTLAASAVYTIDKRLLHITTQENIGGAIGVTEVSVRDHHNRLWRHKSDQIEELLEVAE